MIYILSGLTGLLILVALFTFIHKRRHSEDPETIVAPEAYTDEQIEVFRDILYTLRPEEVEEWLISLEKREINLPLILRQEAIELIP